LPIERIFAIVLNMMSLSQDKTNNTKTLASWQPMVDALSHKQFFKLILGGSYTDTTSIAHVVSAYRQAGINCLDVAADLPAIDCVANVLAMQAFPLSADFSAAEPGDLPALPAPPLVMVSVPLDPDPHFRKIELEATDCTHCGLCLPECPSDALSIPVESLAISQSLCYGCGRCVPVCPTQALSLLPFQVEKTLAQAFEHPIVQAVEIHSYYCDADMLADFLNRWRPLLLNKLLSLCFQGHRHPAGRIVEFYRVAAAFSPFPVIIQVDGLSMSGDTEKNNAMLALEGARQVYTAFQASNLPIPHITISGGINDQTASALKHPDHQFIAGVAMGTVARQRVRGLNLLSAQAEAKKLLSLFRHAAQ
jgi:ferredoxin